MLEMAPFTAFRVTEGGRSEKGTANIQLADGSTHSAEVHWYEATGIGRREIKIKPFPTASSA
jgi:hypothetical protein